jgi:hypothetical protein
MWLAVKFKKKSLELGILVQKVCTYSFTVLKTLSAHVCGLGGSD